MIKDQAWLLSAGGLILIFLTVLTAIILIKEYSKARSNCSFIISFEEFYGYYRLYPDSFRLHHGWVRFIDISDEDCRFTKEYQIGFDFISWVKYEFWRKIKSYLQKMRSKNEKYNDFKKIMNDKD